MPKIEWDQLGFDYMPTNCHIKYTFSKGAWSEAEVVYEDRVTISIAATGLHYGQSAFEGLKAFHGADGQVRIFRPLENAKRLRSSAQRGCMAEVPDEVFLEGCELAIRKNQEFIPPAGSKSALYLRPLLFGSGARMGVAPADEYTFLVIAFPVGDYYKGGMEAVDAMIVDGFDRAAPQGTGAVKMGGNYVASLLPGRIAKEQGCPITLYVDAKEHKYIDEFSTANFVGIKGESYITPKSETILPSVTNRSLMTIAEDIGLKVERRPVLLEEVKEFDAVAACGTAVVMTPVRKIVSSQGVIEVLEEGADVHPTLTALYNGIRDIQFNKVEDKFGWNHLVPL